MCAETMFLVYQPSVIAAAATICSLEEVTALQAADLHRVFVDLSVNVVRMTFMPFLKSAISSSLDFRV
jgi:hypothetical protein